MNAPPPISLTCDKQTWQIILAMLMEQPVPRHIAMPVIAGFERALAEAEKAPPQPAEEAAP